MHIAYMHLGTGLRADLQIVPFMIKVDAQNKNKKWLHKLSRNPLPGESIFSKSCLYTLRQKDLNKKSGALLQTLISFNVDAQAFRKTKNENPPTREWELHTDRSDSQLSLQKD